MNIPESNLPRVVVIGGGFAGINLVKTLANKNIQVVLIDKRNYHTFQPLLYQVSSSGLEPDSIAYPLRKIIKKHKTSFFSLSVVFSFTLFFLDCICFVFCLFIHLFIYYM